MQTNEQKVWCWRGGPEFRGARDHLTVEEPLEIRLDTRPLVTTMRTPGEDRELAAGFLLAEGIIRRAGQIRDIRPYARNRKGNVLDVFLDPVVTVDWGALTRHGVMTSSCGLCGKTTVDSVHRHFKPVSAPLSIAAKDLVRFPDRLRRCQAGFERSGGLHAAAIFTSQGRLVVAREDVGRHNAVDKVLGFGVLQKRLPWNRHVLLVSGRASFEIVQKALAARIPVVAAISAPSSLAVQLAHKSGQTLVGFLRDDTMNLYTHPERIIATGRTVVESKAAKTDAL